MGDIRRGKAESDIICRDRINPISAKLILNNCFILYLFPRTRNAAVKPPPVSTTPNKNIERDAPCMWRQWLICTIWRQMVCKTADTPVLRCYPISDNAIYSIAIKYRRYRIMQFIHPHLSLSCSSFVDFSGTGTGVPVTSSSHPSDVTSTTTTE